MKVRVAAAQPMTFQKEREPENLPVALEYIRQAGEEGAKFICFPEGYPGPYSGSMDFDPTGELADAAKKHGIYVLAGGLEEAGPDAFYNLLDFYTPDGKMAYRYKRCQSAGDGVDLPLFGRHVREGDELKVLETPHGNVGLQVCSEIFSPEMSRVLALDGADIIFYPAGGMFYEVSESWRILVRARAIETGCFVVAPAQGGKHEDGRETFGHSLIVSPWGEVIAEADGAEPGIVLAELDLDEVAKARGRIPSLRNDRDVRMARLGS